MSRMISLFALLLGLSSPAVADPGKLPAELTEALKGVDGKGTDLLATFKTNHGAINCKLLHTAAPKTVANFVGLALGNKPFTDPKSGKQEKRRFYDGLLIHRVVPNFMIQGGDPAGNGSGGPGFSIPDEISPSARHTKPGTLSMANRGPNTGGSQFFITEKATPWLDGKHAVFGECKDVEVIQKIARLPVLPPNRPKEDVRIEKVEISWGSF